MKKPLVTFVLGTRPEAIKMAPVITALEQNSFFQSIVCTTGQHRTMLDGVLDLFSISPLYDLNIMVKGQDLTHITTSVLKGLVDVLKEVQPDRVLVHGDTTTTLAASLASFYAHIPVGHVEAGLRTGNKLAAILTLHTMKYSDNFRFIIIGLLVSSIVYYFKDLSLALGKTDRIPLILSIWTPIITMSLFTLVGVIQINEK